MKEEFKRDNQQRNKMYSLCMIQNIFEDFSEECN